MRRTEAVSRELSQLDMGWLDLHCTWPLSLCVVHKQACEAARLAGEARAFCN